MDKAKGGRFKGERWEWIGGCGGVKMETTLLGQQLKKKEHFLYM